MTTPLLIATEISKQYGGIRAVDQLSFAIQEGEIFALLGPNGAGKTTTIRMLMRIIHPDEGRIDFQLPIPNGLKLANILGYLPEERGLFKDVAILKTLEYMGILRGMSRSDARRESMDWLERLDLADRSKERLDSLSKGNQQKVQFAAAVLHKPRFAVLDEPFSGFDPVNQDLFVAIIKDLRDKGMTLLLSAHQMILVERLADRCLLMNQGRQAALGTVAELRQEQTVKQRLILKLGNDKPTDLQCDHPSIITSEWNGPRTLILSLEEEPSISDLMVYLAQRLDIRTVHTETQNLHQIYVETLAAPNTPEAST